MGDWVRTTGGQAVFPVHPRTRSNMERFGLAMPEGVIETPPFGYVDMQSALFHADRVLTDSGGLQKEAWFQGTSGVVLRDATEWKELVEVGASLLFDPARLLEEGGQRPDAELNRERSVPPVETSGLFGRQAAGQLVDGLMRFVR